MRCPRRWTKQSLLPDEAPEAVASLELGAPQPGDDELDLLPFDDPEDPEDAEGDRPSEIVVAPPVAESDLYEDEPAEEIEEVEEPEDDLMTVQQVAAAPVAATPVKPAPAADTPPELLRLQKSWPEVVNRLSARPATAAVIRDAEPVALMGNTVILQFTSRFNVEKIESNEKGRQVLEDAINKTLGADAGPFKVKALLQGQPLPSGAAGKPRTTVPTPAAPEAAAANVPGAFVEEVIAVFGGRLLDDDAN